MSAVQPVNSLAEVVEQIAAGFEGSRKASMQVKRSRLASP